jgi:hypothetical protein
MEIEVARDNKGCKYSTRRPLLCLKKTVEQSKRERKIAQNKKLAVLQTAATAITKKVEPEGRFYWSQYLDI